MNRVMREVFPTAKSEKQHHKLEHEGAHKTNANGRCQESLDFETAWTRIILAFLGQLTALFSKENKLELSKGIAKVSRRRHF
jgi:hypothetical protein